MEGTLDGTPARFTSATLHVTGTTDDPEQLEKFVTLAERGCIVANTLKDAVDLSFTTAVSA